MSTLHDQLLVELECPVCTNYMAPPIRQCSIGHNVCESCRKKLTQCPMCQGSFSSARNISLEALAQNILYPCINKSAGCLARLQFSKREEHEKGCPYKGYRCAMGNCKWVGRREDILEHWTCKPGTAKLYHSTNVCHLKIKQSLYFANIIVAYSELFWAKNRIKNGKIYWTVQLIGLKEKAADYYYEIELFELGRAKRRIVFGDYCQDANVDDSDLYTEEFCTVTSVESLGRFISEDQTMIYHLRVFETNSPSNEGVQEKGKEGTPTQMYRRSKSSNPLERKQKALSSHVKKPEKKGK